MSSTRRKSSRSKGENQQQICKKKNGQKKLCLEIKDKFTPPKWYQPFYLEFWTQNVVAVLKPAHDAMNKVCQWKKDFLLLVLNAKCIHLWMKSYGVTIDYFKSWKLLSAAFPFSVYYAVQGGSNSPVFGRNPIVRTFKWKLLSGTERSVLIEKLGGRWLCHDELQLIFSRLHWFSQKLRKWMGPTEIP